MSEKKKLQYDVLILGGGPAGLSAAIYAARGAAKTAIIDISMFGGQPSNYLELENYPGFGKIGGYDMMEKFEEHAGMFDIDKYPMQEIEQINLISSPKIIETKEIIFEAKSVSGNGDKNISLQIHRGEVLGLGGLVGAGRTEFAEMVFGAEKKISGQFFFKGKEINPRTPREAIRIGIGLVPEDRKAKGALLDLSIQENINMPIYQRLSRGPVIDYKKAKKIAQKYREEISIKTPSLEQKVKNLSGGNQQKVILAKWLAAESELLIFDEPTRGIDVGAKQEIYTLINELVEQGKAVLMISSEMEELMGMSDRIIILAEGC